MSSINSISSLYSQSISSLYENASLFKTTTDSSSSEGSSSIYHKDSLTLSEEGLSMLQALKETQESEDEDEATSNSKSPEQDVLSRLEELSSSDKLSEDQKTELNSIIASLKEKLESSETGEEADYNSRIEGERPMMPPPPMGPMGFKAEDNEEDESNDTTDAASEDTTSTNSYAMNFEAMVSSGFITQEQANSIMAAFDTVSE